MSAHPVSLLTVQVVPHDVASAQARLFVQLVGVPVEQVPSGDLHIGAASLPLAHTGWHFGVVPALQTPAWHESPVRQ